MSPTLWLSCHVDYACRHSGVCCRAGWPLPVETRVAPAIDGAVASGRVTTVDGARVWLIESAEAPDDMAGTLRQAHGGCVFHQRADGRPPSAAEAGPISGRHCAVHAGLGVDALPSTCRHFPRVCLVDDRGVRVSLSHVCPTAAAMLVDHEGPVAIVDGPAAVPGVAVPEGLDGRGALPPRLTDRALMDLDALTAWEAHVVDVLAGPSTWSAPLEPALASLRQAANRLAGWRAAHGPLVDAVRALDREEGATGARRLETAGSPRAIWQLAASACPTVWLPGPLPSDLEAADAAWVTPRWDAVAPVVRRYLAARAFGAWMVWQADAAHGLVAWLELVAGVLRAECARAASAAGRPLDRAQVIVALGRADRLLVHDADGAQLAAVIAPR